MDKVSFGGQSMVGELKDVLLKQHHPIIDLLKHHGVNVHYPFTNFPQDSLLITDAGAVILRSEQTHSGSVISSPSTTLRVNSVERSQLQIPILAEITEPGLVNSK